MSLKHPLPTRGGAYRWTGKALVADTAPAPAAKPTDQAPKPSASVSTFPGKKSTAGTSTED